MAGNPYDQFDSAGESNPYNQFDAGTPKRGYGPADAIGGIDAAASLASGMAGSVAGGLAGIGQAAKNVFSPGMSAADRVRQVQEATTYQPRTHSGEQIAGAVAYPFEKLAQGADWVGQKAANASGSPLVGAGVNTALQALPMALPLAKGPIGRKAVLAQTEADVLNKLNAPRNEVIDRAKDAGLTISPAEANPSLLNRVLEGFSGQTKVQQLASEKNQPVVNSITRRALGIPEDTPISINSLEAVRKTAGKAYEDVRKAGQVKTTPQYSAGLDAIESKYVGAEKDFPKMAQNDVRDAVNSARVAEFDAGSGVDAIKIQRGLADKAFRQGDTELGKAHKAIADVIEGEIESHLQMTNANTLADFRKARETIAKSYDVQKALRGDNVDVKVLATQLRKSPRKLTGDLRDLADFGTQFPKSAQLLGSKVTPSLWETMGMGGLGGIGAHLAAGAGLGPATAAALAAGATRPLVRAGINSGPYQSVAVNGPVAAPSAFLRLADVLAQNPEYGAAITAAEARRNQGQ